MGKFLPEDLYDKPSWEMDQRLGDDPLPRQPEAPKDYADDDDWERRGYTGRDWAFTAPLLFCAMLLYSAIVAIFLLWPL